MAQRNLEKIFGFNLKERTLTYIPKRFQEAGLQVQHKQSMQTTIPQERVSEFKTIFYEMLGREPFEDRNRRNVDVINAVNFALFHKTQGARIAVEGLRSILKYRKECSGW